MKRLFIFEGPDGAGKTTLARALADRIDAAYFHHGAYPEVGEDLHNVYGVTISVAALGIRDVVMDRSWLSELPYGLAFRDGQDRLGDTKRAALEAYALEKTQVLVIRCDAPLETVILNFNRRQGEEYLQEHGQLFKVWEWYRYDFKTSLPLLVLWPFSMTLDTAIERILDCA